MLTEVLGDIKCSVQSNFYCRYCTRFTILIKLIMKSHSGVLLGNSIGTYAVIAASFVFIYTYIHLLLHKEIFRSEK